MIEQTLKGLADAAEAKHLMRFFKTGPGEYGEGDRFLGIRVPETRRVVRENRLGATMGDARFLIGSPWHEVRLAGFLLLIELYKSAAKKRDESACRDIVGFYLSVLDRGNNWDLVDVIAPKILGTWLLDHESERSMLYQLAAMEGKLWHQRVAVVSTWTLISHGEFDDALRIIEKLRNHRHDLIHKATGWMLREIGKRGGMDRLTEYLDFHAHEMPRTMLRYSIEHLSLERRLRYMGRH